MIKDQNKQTKTPAYFAHRCLNNGGVVREWSFLIKHRDIFMSKKNFCEH